LQAKLIWKKGQALIPNWEAFAVVKLMEKHFEDLVDFAFTAEMEEDLDQIASGDRDKVPYLKEFYFGDKKHPGLQKLVSQNLSNIDAAEINSIYIGGKESGVVVKPGKYGPYIKRGEDTVSVPATLAPDEMTLERAQTLLAAPKGDVPIGKDPATGLNVYVKQGRFGPYVHRGRADLHRAGLQLGLGLGHHLEHAAALHHREAEAAQRGQVAAPGFLRRQGLFAGDGDGALHARVDHDLAVEHGGDGARHHLHLGVDEVQRHRGPGLGGRHGRLGGGVAARCGVGAQTQGQGECHGQAGAGEGAAMRCHGHPIEMRDSAPSRRPMMFSKLFNAAS
jgi:hypothetical protein